MPRSALASIVLSTIFLKPDICRSLPLYNDESGLPMGMQYKASGSTSWTVYYYERNLQGDVIALYSATGIKLITYNYDAYGNK